jgi:heavy metal sensor kinase
MKIFRPRSLRFKLSWTHGIIISIVLACLGLVRYQTVAYRVHRNFDQDLLLDAQFFVSNLSVGPQGIIWSTAELSPTNALIMEEFRSYLVITDSGGNVVQPDLHGPFLRQLLAHEGMKAVLRQHSGFGQVAGTDGVRYRFVSMPVPNKGANLDYVAHLGRSTSEMTGVLNEYLLVYLYSVPLMLIVSAGVGWFLAGRALRPFEKISQTAEKITSSNLNLQITSEHKEHEVQTLVRSFNSMVSRLEHSFRQMRQFNADVAHDLRTPLAVLQVENEIALRSSSLSNDTRAVLSSNLEELERLTRMVNDMLTLAEAEAGSQILRKTPIALKPLLLDLVDQLNLLASVRNIQIEMHDLVDADIDADVFWIRRAFLNVLDNAIKYSKDGGCIEIRTEVKDGQVHISVRDDGIGIAAADLPRLFDRFFRSDPVRARGGGGFGLGLPLVRWIVGAHSGEINISSSPGKGTCVEMAFPLSRDAADRA